MFDVTQPTEAQPGCLPSDQGALISNNELSSNGVSVSDGLPQGVSAVSTLPERKVGCEVKVVCQWPVADTKRRTCLFGAGAIGRRSRTCRGLAMNQSID